MVVTDQILFDETSGIVPPLLAAIESHIFDKMSGQFSAVLVATNLDIFKELEGFFQLCRLLRYHFAALLLARKTDIFDATSCEIYLKNILKCFVFLP